MGFLTPALKNLLHQLKAQLKGGALVYELSILEDNILDICPVIYWHMHRDKYEEAYDVDAVLNKTIYLNIVYNVYAQHYVW